MKKFKIRLNTFDDVKDFCNVVKTLPGDMDLSHGHYVVDAKSVMGVYSLDLSNVLELTCYEDDTEALEFAITRWRV